MPLYEDQRPFGQLYGVPLKMYREFLHSAFRPGWWFGSNRTDEIAETYEMKRILNIAVTAGLFLGLCAVLTAGCGPCGPAGSRRPHVIIYLVDTLRPDHLGVYGYSKDTSPNLDAFARDAVVFKQAYTPAAWTKPATASLLTGLLPFKHGAITRTNRIPENIHLISEFLKDLAYTTAAFMANPNVIALWGFDQGFDRFDDVKKRTGKDHAEKVVDLALDFLSSGPARPLFLFLHTIDPHGPYKPPASFEYPWAEGLDGRVMRPRDLSAKTSAADFERTIAAYDGEIAYNDQQFGRFLRALKAEGLYGDAFIVFVADHGEEHAEHGRGGHSHTLYQELVRVPMVIKFPGNAHAGRTVDAPVDLMDVLPTVLAHLGRPCPEILDGRDLENLLEGKADKNRILYFDLDTERFDGSINILGAVLYRDYKLIKREHPVKETVLYNLAEDPLEEHDLMATEKDRARKLEILLVKNRLEAQRGVRLRFINGPGETVRLFEGTLATTGRFVNLEGSQMEEEDHLKLDESGKRLSFRIVSRNYRNRIHKIHPVAIDEDCLTFRLEPPEASFTVESFHCEGMDGPPLYLGQDQKPVEGLAITFHMDSLEILAFDESVIRRTSVQSVTDLPPGGYLIAVPERIRENVEMDAATRERLKELGYIK